MRRRRLLPFLLALSVTFGIPASSYATAITATATADDTFTFYLSTNDTLLGTQFCTAAGLWFTPTTCPASPALTPNTTYYLHVVASDIYGPPSMFIGTFGLTDSAFQFSNGTQSLNTNATNWVVRVNSFADSNATLVDLGQNGTNVWGSVSGVNSGARFIWEQSGIGCTGCTRYFSTTITPTQTTAPVPEPSTLLLLGGGLLAISAAARRRIRS